MTPEQRMRVFVYEFVTGGGMWSLGSDSPNGSLLAEGRAMAAAVCADLTALPGVRVTALLDSRIARFATGGTRTVSIDSAAAERDEFARQAASADWTLIVAPETAGVLQERCAWAVAAKGRLLSPGPDVVRLASDKQATAERLAACGVRVPLGMRIDSRRTEPIPAELFPAVLKPLDGCGSLGVRRIEGPAELEAAPVTQPMRLERWIPGQPASVATVCGQGDFLIALPACEQRLSADDRFMYLGGRLPLAGALDERARRLALAAAKALPNPRGYVGVDLVLGRNPFGNEDFVIEINPRLTTSYVGLRALCRDNLAAAMLAVAQGKAPDLSWREGSVQFWSDGRVEYTR